MSDILENGDFCYIATIRNRETRRTITISFTNGNERESFIKTLPRKAELVRAHEIELMNAAEALDELLEIGIVADECEEEEHQY